MPHLNVWIARNESSDIAENVVSALMKRTSELLGKKPEVTSIAIDFVSPDLWFVGGERVSAQTAVTFYSGAIVMSSHGRNAHYTGRPYRERAIRFRADDKFAFRRSQS